MASYTGRPGIDWGSVAQMVGVDTDVRRFEEDQKANALRWQGQQDYGTLVASGIDPMEALKRTAHKIFYNDPEGLAKTVESFQASSQPPVKGRIFEEGGETYIDNDGRVVHVQKQSSKIKPEPEIRTLPDGTKVFSGGGPWSIMPAEKEKRDPTANVSVTTKLGDGSTLREVISQDELKRREITAAQQKYNEEAAKKPSFFGMFGGPDVKAMNVSSNELRNLGVNAMTGQPIQPAAPVPVPANAVPVTAPTPQSASPPPVKTVKVISPSGIRGTMPIDKFSEALKKDNRWKIDNDNPPANPAFLKYSNSGIMG